MTDSPHDILSAPARLGRVSELPGANQRGEFMRLLTKLRDLAGSDRNFVVAFSCSMGGEGTTTVAMQFAIGAAQSGADQRVLIVDGNLDSPDVAELLGADAGPGVHEVCNEGVPVRDAIHGTELENLDVLPAGRTEPGSAGYLNSLRFREVIQQCRQQYDLVVVDCPPLSSGHAATHLPEEDALTVLVLEASSTRREVIDGARHELRLMGAKVAGVVLNRRRFFVPSFVYRRL